MPVKLTPLINHPVLLAEHKKQCLIVADLHLGIEWDLHHSGITLPSQTPKLLKKLTACIKQTTPEHIILLGDVKHNVPKTSKQEQEELPAFIKELASHAQVHITPGNHDSDIEHLLQEQIDDELCTITPPKGTIIDGVGYLHGHTWPSPELLQAPYIITAHNHPSIQFTDPMGHTTQQPAWIRTKLQRTPFEQHYQHLSLQWGNPELIIVPAFNHLCGGISFNTTNPNEFLGPLIKAADLQEAQTYLLDGTHLGKLSSLATLGGRQRVSKTSYTWYV